MDTVLAALFAPVPGPVKAILFLLAMFALFAALVWLLTADEMREIDAVHKQAEERRHARPVHMRCPETGELCSKCPAKNTGCEATR